MNSESSPSYKPYLEENVVTAGQVYAHGLHPGACEVSEATKQVVADIFARFPVFHDLPQNSRIFVRRATRYMVDAGIDQILDLGSGLPTDSNTHEVAQRKLPGARVVYVDNDEMTHLQARDMLAGSHGVGFLHHDVCDIDAVLQDQVTQTMIDFSRPVGLMLASVVHLISEEHCQQVAGLSTHELVRAYVDRLPAGSMVAFEHYTADGQDPTEVEAIDGLGVGIVFRPAEQIRAYFDGLRLVQPYLAEDATDEPDIVWSNRWQAPKPFEAHRTGSFILGGVGVKD